MPIGPNEGNVGRSARPGSRKSTYGQSPQKQPWKPPHCRDRPDLDVPHRTPKRRHQLGFLTPWLNNPVVSTPRPTPTLHEVPTIRTGPGITDQLRHAKAARWRRRDITAQEWKANNGETEASPLVAVQQQNRREGNDQEPIQLSHTFHQIHQRERNTNTK